MSRPQHRRRRGYRGALRAAAVALLGGSVAMLALPSAPAVGASGPPVLSAGWFWQSAYEQANPPVAPPTTPPSEPSGVPSGDLAVAWTGAQDSAGEKTPAKMTALAFNVPQLTPGATVQKFTFTLTLDGSPSATSFGTQDATVVACLPTRGWPATLPDGGDYTNEPTYDCANPIAPTVSGSTYTFSIASIAQTWADDQNLGVALVPDPKKTQAPFQLVFQGPKAITASMAFTPAAPLATTPPPPAGGGTTTTTGGGAPGGTGDTGPGVAPLPLPSSDVASPAASTPVVAPSTPPVVTTPVAAVKAASAVPTAGFWVAGIVLALLMLVVSLVLGDPNPPVAASARSRLDRALREQSFGV